MIRTLVIVELDSEQRRSRSKSNNDSLTLPREKYFSSRSLPLKLDYTVSFRYVFIGSILGYFEPADFTIINCCILNAMSEPPESSLGDYQAQLTRFITGEGYFAGNDWCFSSLRSAPYLSTYRPLRLFYSSSLLSSSCGSPCQKTPPSREWGKLPRQRPQPFEDFKTQSLFVSRESETESALMYAHIHTVAGIINTPICLHSSSYKVSQTHPSVARPSVRPSIRALDFFGRLSISLFPPPHSSRGKKMAKRRSHRTKERERGSRRDRRRRRSSRRRDGRVACVRRTGRVISSALFCLSLFLSLFLCAPFSTSPFAAIFFLFLLILLLPPPSPLTHFFFLRSSMRGLETRLINIAGMAASLFSRVPGSQSAFTGHCTHDARMYYECHSLYSTSSSASFFYPSSVAASARLGLKMRGMDINAVQYSRKLYLENFCDKFSTYAERNFEAIKNRKLIEDAYWNFIF